MVLEGVNVEDEGTTTVTLAGFAEHFVTFVGEPEPCVVAGQAIKAHGN